MSIKSTLVKATMKLTPKALDLWVINKKLKGIAELKDLTFDLDERTAYIRAMLEGEDEPMELWLDGFVVVTKGKTRKLFIEKAKSNRPWLNNVLAKVVGKEWKIPKLPKFAEQIDLLSDLLKGEVPSKKAADDDVEIA